MPIPIKAVNRIEILTLQDNYIDLVSGDSTAILKRAMPVKNCEIKNSILAEHGFSTFITFTADKVSHSFLFDFGFSEHGAAFNADALDVDLTKVEALVLSHGHIDHFGGLRRLVAKIGRKEIPLILHPAAFRQSRHIQLTAQLRINLPAFIRKDLVAWGIAPTESAKPSLFLDNSLLFLGEIPRTTDFEKGMPNAYYEEDGKVKEDHIEDDSAIVMNVKNKGLVILSGCAHSGMINIIRYAQKVTGINAIFAVMGGFHLTGPDYVDIIKPTTDALKEINPTYVVPAHCTGRNAAMFIEKSMHDQFLLSMSGTRLILAA